MNTSLTTFDGYPRDDLDIAQSKKAAWSTKLLLLTSGQLGPQEQG
jgi:hypothetical protein